MANIIISPSLDRVVVQKSGAFSLPREDSQLECNCPQFRGPCGGIPLNKIPLQFAKFERLCKEMGVRFIRQQHSRGFDECGGGLVVHGPWPSKMRHIEDPTTPEWRGIDRRQADGFEHPELAAAKVDTFDDASDWVDYVLVGDFAFKDRMTDLELP